VRRKAQYSARDTTPGAATQAQHGR